MSEMNTVVAVEIVIVVVESVVVTSVVVEEEVSVLACVLDVLDVSDGVIRVLLVLVVVCVLAVVVIVSDMEVIERVVGSREVVVKLAALVRLPIRKRSSTRSSDNRSAHLLVPEGVMYATSEKAPISSCASVSV